MHCLMPIYIEITGAVKHMLIQKIVTINYPVIPALRKINPSQKSSFTGSK